MPPTINLVGPALQAVKATAQINSVSKVTKSIVTIDKVTDVLQTNKKLASITEDAAVAAANWANGARTVEQAGISAADALRIQNAATKTGQKITVVGSRANGTATAASDWDFILSGNSAARHSAASSLPRGAAGGEAFRPGIDLFQDFNPKALGYNVLDPTRPYITFYP